MKYLGSSEVYIPGFPGLFSANQIYDVSEDQAKILLSTGQFEEVIEARGKKEKALIEELKEVSE